MPKPKVSKQVTPQSKRFIEAARELGCDEDEATFDRTLKAMASVPPPKRFRNARPKSPPNERAFSISEANKHHFRLWVCKTDNRHGNGGIIIPHAGILVPHKVTT